jgi:hypothetical protein
MKKLLWIMALSLLANHGYADNWQNVEVDKTLGCSLARSMIADDHGILYAIGSGSLDCKSRTWVVKKSVDHGVTWNVIDNFTTNKNLSTEPAAIAVGPKNSIIVVGKSEYLTKTGQILTQWITRISKDGKNWKTKDNFQLPGVSWTRAAGVVTDHSGNIFVFGSVQTDYINSQRPAQCNCQLIIRKSHDLGKSWSTIVVNKNFYLWAVGISITAQDELYVISQSQTQDQGGTKFLVEKSIDAGETWTDVDHFGLFDIGAGTHATTIHIDEKGVIYTAGLSALTLTGIKHWIVRKSEDDGVHWLNIDDYIGDGLEYSWPESIYTNLAGEIFVAGYHYRNKNLVSWIVRKFSNGQWQNSDDFTSANKNAGASGIFGDPTTGQMFATGFTDGFWTIRKGDSHLFPTLFQ